MCLPTFTIRARSATWEGLFKIPTPTTMNTPTKSIAMLLMAATLTTARAEVFQVRKDTYGSTSGPRVEM